MLRKVYSFLFYFLVPFLKIKDFFDKNKFPKGRVQERYGRTHIKRPTAPLVWFHGASVGECLALIPVMNAIHKQYPHVTLLITAGTHAAARFLPTHLPKGAIHQYVPYDHSLYVKRFLDYWQPSFVIWVEADYWPNLIITTAHRNIPVILLNGRLSIRAFTRWQYYPPLIKIVIQKFQYIIAQTKEDAGRFTYLGNNDVQVDTNLKYFIQIPPLDKNAADHLKASLRNRPILFAASTHPGEEAMLLSVFKRLKKSTPQLLMIIAPRHTTRCHEIVQAIKKERLTYAVRSQNETVTSMTDIYLADTFGELHLFFHICPIVFIGGSLFPIGGHTPVEPAYHNCALLSGPHTFKNIKIFEEFYEASACILTHTSQELFTAFTNLLTDKQYQQKLATNAFNLVMKKRQTEQRYMRRILDTLYPYVGH